MDEIRIAEDWAPGQRRTPALFAEYARLRGSCPVAYSHEFGGFWSLLRYADIRAAAVQSAVFRSGRPFVMDAGGDRFIPESLNPPEHTIYRRILNPHFKPVRMPLLEPVVRALAASHLDGLVARGGGDVVAELAYPLPTRVLCAFLNLPDEDWPQIKALTRERTLASGDAERTRVAADKFLHLIHPLIEERLARPMPPTQDLVSGLLHATVEDGRSLSRAEIAEICYQVIIAGADTTSAMLGSAVFLLCEHPDQQALLRADPSLVPSAVEEILRLEPALHYMGRIVSGEACVRGRVLRDGEVVAFNFASANRDSDAFVTPDSFDVVRSPNPHLTFGHGIHKCVGAPLARLELRVVIEELLARTASLTFAAPPQRGSSFPSAFAKVPITVSPLF